jgi:hypothetical protein
VPAATTEKVAFPPTVAVTAAGCVVIVGAVAVWAEAPAEASKRVARWVRNERRRMDDRFGWLRL